MASGPWSDDEIHRTIDVYFAMLTLELGGESYAKSLYRAEAARDIDRTNAAIDYKFNNVSAVLDEIGAVWIAGYKPLRNVQQRLRELVQERFEADAELRSFMLRAVEGAAAEQSAIGSQVQPAELEWPAATGGSRVAKGINFAEVEAANRALGLAREQSVVAHERRRLEIAGRSDLAREVRHVAVEDGDGLGYDVASFAGATDRPTYLEVKTTRHGKELPFFLSSNELETSRKHGEQYSLVRLFRFGTGQAGFYVLPGPLDESAQLRASVFRGLPAVSKAASTA